MNSIGIAGLSVFPSRALRAGCGAVALASPSGASLGAGAGGGAARALASGASRAALFLPDWPSVLPAADDTISEYCYTLLYLPRAVFNF